MPLRHAFCTEKKAHEGVMQQKVNSYSIFFEENGVLKQVNCIILETEFNCEKYFCISIGQNLFYDFFHVRVWLPFINKIKRCQYNLFIRNVIIICFHKQLRNCNATAILWQAQLHDLSVKC